MANWSDLKAAVASIVKTNGNKEITGQLLQNVLNNIISNVGANSSFAGIATPETNPGTPDGNVFYLATTAGTYSNFNGIVINYGEAVIIEWRGSWVKKDSGFATQKKLTELGYLDSQKAGVIGVELFKDLSLENAIESNYYLNSDGSWIQAVTYKSYLIPVTKGTVVFLKANANKNAIYAFVDGVGGTMYGEWMRTSINEYGSAVAPQDCYFYVAELSGTATSHFPELLKANIGETRMQSVQSDINSLQFAIGKTLNLDNSDHKSNHFLYPDNSWLESIGYLSLYFHVNEGERISLRANADNNAIIAFLDGYENSSFIEGTERMTIPKGSSSSVVAPADCVLYVLYKNGDATNYPESIGIINESLIGEMYSDVQGLKEREGKVYNVNTKTKEEVEGCDIYLNGKILLGQTAVIGQNISLIEQGSSTGNIVYKIPLPGAKCVVRYPVTKTSIGMCSLATDVKNNVLWVHIERVLETGTLKEVEFGEDAAWFYLNVSPSLSQMDYSFSISEIKELVDIKRTVDVLDSKNISVIPLDYGVVTGNYTTYGNLFDVNGKPNMRTDAISFHQYRRTNFIAAKGFFNILDSEIPVGIYLMFNKNFEYIGQDVLKKDNTLASEVMYIKLCTKGSGIANAVEWSQGSVDTSDAETNRIRSSAVPFNDVGTVFFSGSGKRLFIRYYDSEDTLIGNSFAQVGILCTRGQIINAFSRVVDGKTIDDVAYMRFGAGYISNADIDVEEAPVIYAQGDNTQGTITIETYGGDIIYDKNEYGKTFRLVYNTPVNHNEDDTSTSLYYSTMMLRLPKNYVQKGKPTPLIIFKSGSRSYDDIFEADFYYLNFINYWVDQGYAVMDYHGGTSKYPTNDAFGCATNLASASAAYKFVVDTYNIDKGGVYLSCKSLGGYMTHELLFNGSIPIKAAAMLAPAIDNKRYCFGYYGFQRLNFASDMGFVGDLTVLEGSDTESRTDITIQYSDAFKTLVKDNIVRLYGFMPILNGVINKTLDELLELHTEIADSFSDVMRVHRIPTRYWVSKDDESTPYEIAENYVKSCQNTFSPVTLRTMPSGVGGHHSVDDHANAPKVDSITTRLGVTYTDFPIAYIEALNFLERY